MKNGKIQGHTDNYMKVKMDGEKNLINTIQSVSLIKNEGDYFHGML
ncbi:MAG: hypothetical protein ISR83_09615, partial [Candidatus Marinimicrobia bacterium]|nr:hypothetical protein [Candidatus Neomarinimicrobiota bacterium]